jgi:hypothetical protein
VGARRRAVYPDRSFMLPEAIRTLLADVGVRPERGRALPDLVAALSPQMLDEIARADYAFDASDHRGALQEIIDSLEVPDRRGHTYPWEVLELTRWSTPDYKRGHVKRAFSCAALLLAAGVPGTSSYFIGEPPTVMNLLTSARALGEPHLSSVAGLIAWRLAETEVEVADSLFFILGLLIVLRTSSAFTVKPDQWSALATWLDEAELNARIENGSDLGDWLLDVAGHHVQHGLWKRAAQEHFASPPLGAELIGQRIAEWTRA